MASDLSETWGTALLLAAKRLHDQVDFGFGRDLPVYSDGELPPSPVNLWRTPDGKCHYTLLIGRGDDDDL